jgi:uncharacterized membrane protein YeaQ/YmgE (transglycosylase-associated protein family)
MRARALQFDDQHDDTKNSRVQESPGQPNWQRRAAVGARCAPSPSIMTILGWIILGLLAGFIASKIVNKTGEGVVLDIVLGIVGAVVGGLAFNALGSSGVTGFNVWSLFVAVLGAVVLLGLYHLITGRTRRFA